MKLKIAAICACLCTFSLFGIIAFGSESMQLPDGSVYSGNLIENKFHGHGKLTWSDGDTYEGEFESGLFSGQGELITDETERYTGTFSKGVKSGFGKEYYADELIYEGYFKNNEYSGSGIYAFDDETYKGAFEDGEFTGNGTYTNAEKTSYTGKFLNWAIDGEAIKEDAEGSKWQGTFAYGFLTGKGEFWGADGAYYKGEFQYDKFHNQGILTYPNGSVYTGHFNYGELNGAGILKSTNSDGSSSIQKGIWSNGEYAGNPNNKHYAHRFKKRGDLIYQQNELLELALGKLEAQDENAIDIYALTVAAYGKQLVFTTEINIINALLQEQGIGKGRQVSLYNSRKNLESPWATHYAIDASLKKIASLIDLKQDVLLMYITSHGSKDKGVSLNIHGMNLGYISPTQLSESLDNSGIKWRVIIISACYSGSFIDALKNDNSIIITASSKNRQSFGCSNDLDMTYFGEAYFKDSLTHLNFISAFHKAKEIVKQREQKEGYKHSRPQIHIGKKIEIYLENTQL